jgi:hypothetical protein
VPFAYHLDTTQLLNGTYTLKTVSLYTSGKTTTSTQKLVVSNPLSWTQFRLLAQHYAAVVLLPLSIALIAIVVWIYRKQLIKWFNGLNGPHGSVGGGKPVNFQTPPSTITPSSGGTMSGATLTPQTVVVPVQDDGFRS